MTNVVGTRLLSVIRIAIGVAMLGAIVLNFANVIGRYVFLRPIIWAEEVMVYAMIWMIFLGAGLASWEQTHLRMEAIHESLPPRLKRALNTLIALVSIVVGVYVIFLSTEVLNRMLTASQKSVAAGIPMVIPFAAVPIGFAVIIVASLIRLVRPGETSKEELIDRPLL